MKAIVMSILIGLLVIVQRIDTGIGGVGNKRTSGDHPNYSIVDIDKITENFLADLRRLAVTQTPVDNKWIK